MDAVRNAGKDVAVVVIGYDDAAHVTEAVRSALGQGAAVREVIAVDDCSTDGSADLLGRLAASEPRLRVIRRRANSGGCGTPRNTGLDAVTAPYVMFLDSDDVLPPGAVDALLAAAAGARAEVVGGLCVRRELPSGREVPWQSGLYAHHTVVPWPARRPRLVHDTLCVNKLYRTDFLRAHRIRFPEGRFPYEDVVFTARVLAAAPRIALVPDRVYVWHVRRSAERLSISLDRAGVDNWRARTEACRQAYEILLGAGQKELARAARAKFLDHDLRMYLRELGLRDAAYRRAWWELTRAHLAQYDADDWARNPGAPGRLAGRVVLASPEPRDLPRLRELAARPARLRPPYARAADGTPVWSGDLPQVSLEPLLSAPVRALPLAVDAALRPGARDTRLRLRLHELYGRVGRAEPQTVEVEWCHRDDAAVVIRGGTAALVPCTTGPATAPGDPAEPDRPPSARPAATAAAGRAESKGGGGSPETTGGGGSPETTGDGGSPVTTAAGPAETFVGTPTEPCAAGPETTVTTGPAGTLRTRSAESTAARSAGTPEAGPAETTAARSAGTPEAGSAEATAVRSTETPAAGTADTTAAESAGTPEAGSAETTAARSAETPVAGTADTTAAGSAGTPEAGSAETTAARSAETPVAGTADTTAAESAGTPETGPAETTAARSTETPVAGTADTTAAESAGTPEAGPAETTAARSTEPPVAGPADTTASRSAGTPGVRSAGTPEAGSAEAGSAEATAARSTETPAAGTADTTAAESAGTPRAGSPESAAARSPETSAARSPEAPAAEATDATASGAVGASVEAPAGWVAEVGVDLAAFGAGTWDLRLRVRFRDGGSREVTAHALTGAGLLRRRAVPSARRGVVLVQPYPTHSGALALRVAPGVRGVLSVVRRRLRRLLH